MDDIDESMLAGLSETDLKELSELIDPDVSVCLMSNYHELFYLHYTSTTFGSCTCMLLYPCDMPCFPVQTLQSLG